jgi:hypothetical protein
MFALAEKCDENGRKGEKNKAGLCLFQGASWIGMTANALRGALGARSEQFSNADNAEPCN